MADRAAYRVATLIDMSDAEVLDETYERLACTGPEFDGFLSNHAPMAADALIRLGRAEVVEGWVSGYRSRLEDAPEQRFPIDEAEWREPLGDASRLGDWCALFARLVREQPWESLVQEWWPRLMPGAVASATHCLIRTGHVVRALREDPTPDRLAELGRALGYWAARWHPFPGLAPRGSLDAEAALAQVPGVGSHGGIRTRLAELEADPGWMSCLTRLRAVDTPDAVPAALDALVDAAVTGYGQWADHNPVMLVHAATGPRAVSLLLPSLPQQRWIEAYDAAWVISAAICGAYRSDTPVPSPFDREQGTSSGDDASVERVSDLAVASGDEHAIKFIEVAVESHRRGNPAALAAGVRAAALLVAD
jgi:hypothetical protein